MSQRMQIAAGAVLHDDARKVGGLKFSIKSGQKRVVQKPHDFPLSLRPLRLLLQRQHLVIHHFHGVKPPLLRRRAEAAQVHSADVAAPDLPHQAEVAEGQVCLQSNGLERGVRRTVRLQRRLLLRRARRELEGQPAETCAMAHSRVAAHRTDFAGVKSFRSQLLRTPAGFV